MKRQIRKWSLRIIITGLLITGLLFVIVLYPVLTYANRTKYERHTIYHNKTLDPRITFRIEQAFKVIKLSELYSSKLELDICLNDGALYPQVIFGIRGRAFAWGFYDKVIVQGMSNYESDYVELDGYRWNLTQLLAHEMTHCYQFDKLGLFKSNPVANVPDWKWEGYAEYVSRQNTDQKDLSRNLSRYQAADKKAWEIKFSDSTIAPREYYEYWMLVQYCIDVRKMSYMQILADTTKEESIRAEMIKWYEEKKSERTT